MSLPRAPMLLALPLLLGPLAACSEDGDATAEPSSSDATAGNDTDAESETETEICLGVSAADLAGWTGSDQVLDEVDDADLERASCSTEYDETGLTVEWSVRPLIGSFQVEGENAELNGLQRERVDLAGGLPAWQLTGDVSGNRLASVVTVLEDDRTLVVEAGDDGDAEATFTDDQMDEIVVRVANTVAEAQTA